MEPLLSSFMTFGSHLDPMEGSYYSNITGFIRGDTKFHNITPAFKPSPSPDHKWRQYAEKLMIGTNTTEVIERSGTWNWTGSDRVALSVVEKNPLSGQDRSLNLTEVLTLVHVSSLFQSVI